MNYFFIFFKLFKIIFSFSLSDKIINEKTLNDIIRLFSYTQLYQLIVDLLLFMIFRCAF